MKDPDIPTGFESIAETVKRVQEFLRGLDLMPEQPPKDPRERALWLKRNRNTGPEKPNEWRKR